MSEIAKLLEKIFSRTVDLIIDSKISEYEKEGLKGVEERPKILEELDKEINRRLTSYLKGVPEIERTTAVPVPETKPKIEKTVGYCVNCFVKHYGRSRIYAGEAIDFYERDKAMTERVQHKAQAVMDELAGMDDDTSPDMPSFLWQSWREADKLRKWIEAKGLNIGLGASDDLRYIEKRLGELQEELRQGYKKFLVREAVDDIVKVYGKGHKAVEAAKAYEAGKITWDELVRKVKEAGIEREFFGYYDEVKKLVGEKV